jgi:hypothetical protein
MSSYIAEELSSLYRLNRDRKTPKSRCDFPTRNAWGEPDRQDTPDLYKYRKVEQSRQLAHHFEALFADGPVHLTCRRCSAFLSRSSATELISDRETRRMFQQTASTAPVICSHARKQSWYYTGLRPGAVELLRMTGHS